MADFPPLRHDGTGKTLYVTFTNTAGQYWNTTGTPAYETLVPGSWGDYDTAATETPASSYQYIAAVPATLTTDAAVFVTYYEQAGGSPAITDPVVADAVWFWDGTGISDILVGETVEPGQGAPPAALGLIGKLRYVYKNWRNKKTQTATAANLHDDAGTTVDQTSVVSDDGTTFTKGEIISG